MLKICMTLSRAFYTLVMVMMIGTFVLLVRPGLSLSADRVTVLLDWFVNPDHAPLVIAQVHGLFAKHSLEVELIEPADPNDPPKLIAAGHGDVAISYQPQLHVQTARGLPLVRFGTLIASPLNSLVVLADGPVRTLHDLRGRKIGFSVGGFEDIILGTMLNTVGLQLEDVTLINVNFALTASLLSQQVDAVIGAFRNFELNQLELQGRSGRGFYPEEAGVPPYDELILITHRRTIEDERLPRLLDAIEEAALFIINHPQEGWQMFIETSPHLDIALNHRAWFDTIPRLSLSPGALDRRRYQRYGQFLFERGLIEHVLPLDDYAVSLP